MNGAVEWTAEVFQVLAYRIQTEKFEMILVLMTTLHASNGMGFIDLREQGVSAII